jgi:S-adenosylmethionine/arginine decarboxylase-like enzyme
MIVNAAGCSPNTIRCATNITNFSRVLVKRIDMVAYGLPQIVMFGTGNKKGYTLVQLIETSNITAHFVEETNDMYLDVFSCKPFSPHDVESVVNIYFSPINKNRMFLHRQAYSKDHLENEKILKSPVELK